MYKLLLKSKATPYGLERLLALIPPLFAVPEVNTPPWPYTRVAVVEPEG